MTEDAQALKELVRREFTKQAPLYARNPLIWDQERLAALVEMVAPSPRDRVLEVAAGPGYVAMAFAEKCKEVVAIDLTEAQLEEGKRLCAKRNIANVAFELGDAEKLRFGDGEFDAVVCRLAFHHFGSPERVLSEMARVCKAGGKVAVEDLVASEHPHRAARLNRIERLRDPSHVRSLTLSELIGMFTRSGLEIEELSLSYLKQEAARWLANACTPADDARRVMELLEEDEQNDQSGTRPYRENGKLHFVQRTGRIVGRKLSCRS